jgi:signal transduction histidine kinase
LKIDLERLPCAVLDLGPDRRIRAANAAAAHLTRRPVDDLVGRALGDLLAPPDAGDPPVWHTDWHPSAHLRSVRAIPEHRVEIRLAEGGRAEALVIGAYERGPGGELTGAVLTLRPSRRRGRPEPTGIEVVSTVSHELRSPLTSVKGYTSLLLNRWDRLQDEQKRMMLEQVHHDADRVTRLVNELLDISRLETGRLVLRRQLVDVAEVAQRVVEKVGLEYPELECGIEFPDDVPRVYADPDKVEQVLTNLVENAAKYASPRDMQVVASVDGEHVAVAVLDKGEGIPAADLPRVFDKFFRREVGRPTGSGLGLWISRGLVEAHGGRLTARSVEGEGSVFTFTLPTDAFEQLHGHERAGANAPGRGTTGDGR